MYRRPSVTECKKITTKIQISSSSGITKADFTWHTTQLTGDRRPLGQKLLFHNTLDSMHTAE